MNELEDIKGIMQLYMLDPSPFSPTQDSIRCNIATAIPCLNFSALPAGAVLHLLPSTAFFQLKSFGTGIWVLYSFPVL